MTDSDSSALVEPDFKEILTPRLRLRTVRVSDAEALMQSELITRQDVMKWTSHGPVSNIDQARRWLSVRALGKDVFNFAIELKKNKASDPTVAPIIGLAGSFHLPVCGSIERTTPFSFKSRSFEIGADISARGYQEVGYMVHPDYAGNGYATEAIESIIPQLFERMPTASQGGVGFDYVEGWTDISNLASQRILAKCGFTYCETIPDPENQMRGPTETLIFRRARPGKSLDELGLVASKESTSESDAPTPPVQ